MDFFEEIPQDEITCKTLKRFIRSATHKDFFMMLENEEACKHWEQLLGKAADNEILRESIEYDIFRNKLRMLGMDIGICRRYIENALEYAISTENKKDIEYILKRDDILLKIYEVIFKSPNSQTGLETKRFLDSLSNQNTES